MFVPIDSIRPDKNQPRKVFDEKHLEALAKSLATEGMINDIEIDPDNVIITGERRWRAAKLLKWPKVPVKINSSIEDAYTRLRRQMAENVHQSGMSMDAMNPIDTARGYAKLISLKLGKDYLPGRQSREEMYGVIKELTEEVGIPESTIYEFLHLLDEPLAIQEDIAQGRPRTYYRAADNAPEEVREQIREKILGGEYTSREEIRQDARIARDLPSLIPTQLDREQAKESFATNRILNGVARLGLALESLSLNEIDVREKGIVKSQLNWLAKMIERYLNG